MQIICKIIFITFISTICCIKSKAQEFPIQNLLEMKDMIAICNSYTFLDLYNTDSEIIPKGYTRIYSSVVFGMDNKYQIYTKDSIAVINLRGSTGKSISWMENIYAAMIPSNGKIVLQEDTFYYSFAQDTSASVHAGYTLGIALLSKDILHNIEKLNTKGIYNIIITGFSQGGALAYLLRAYLENAPSSIVSKKNKFKTYAFANPMVGNIAFSKEYSINFCSNNSSFSIVNVDDFVPKMPLSYSEEKLFSQENLTSLIFERNNIDIKQLATDYAIRKMEKKITGYVQYTGCSLEKKIEREVGQIGMPNYLDEINYAPMKNRIEILHFEYPKILKDSTILQNDSLMQIYKRGEDGFFENSQLYKSSPNSYNHKPYNYYVGILKKFFPKDYQKLKRLYLKENL